MTTDTASILDIPVPAGGAATLPATGAVTACFEEYRQFAHAELLWISRTIKQIKQSDDADVLDHLYRKGHVIAKLAEILDIPRLARLLSILDLVFGLAREIGAFDAHSMRYLATLLVDTSVRLLDELGSKGSTSFEIADIVGECRSYLIRPLAERKGRLEHVDRAKRRVADEAVHEIGREQEGDDQRVEWLGRPVEQHPADERALAGPFGRDAA